MNEVVWVLVALALVGAVVFAVIRNRRSPRGGSAGGTDSGASHQVEK